MNPRSIFISVCGGARNLLTPYVDSYRVAGRFVVEISTGTFADTPMVGATVVEIKPRKRRHDLSRSFSNSDSGRAMSDALAYVRELKHRGTPGAVL